MNEVLIMADKYPAPWHLSGQGFVITYDFERSFVVKHTPSFLKGKFDGGMGAIVVANYEASECGPYSEILFVPGRYIHQGEKFRTIEKIYVSSKAAKEGGQENWGIPKELADFEWESFPSGLEQLVVYKNKEPIIRIKFKMTKFTFPVDARWSTTPFIQKKGDDLIKVKLRGSGKGRMASVVAMEINEDYFPDVSKIDSITALKVDSFNIKFPRAKVIKERLEEKVEDQPKKSWFKKLFKA